MLFCKLVIRVMKKIFKKLSGIILCFLMLFSIAFIDTAQKQENSEIKGSGYYYENSESYLNDLIVSSEEIPAKYNLSEHYPIVNENQKESSLCWIYASAKSLESAFMIQRNEFYNFSETALAYLSYAEAADNFGNYALFNTGGNFSDFVQIYQDHGLVLESDFSNEEYADISFKTYKDYYYVRDYATTELNSIIKPYYISRLYGYTSVTSPAKIKIIKKFVKMYGSVFAAIEGSNAQGYERGCFYDASSATNREGYSFYDYNRAPHKNDQSYQPLNENHAISIIGWNDDVEFGSEKGAFLAMNSWGYEQSSIRLFYIPYTYTSVLNDCATFIVEGDTEKISIESASHSSFNSSILKSSKQVDNFFAYDDEIWVNYNVKLDSLDNLDVRISSGSRMFNGLFTVTTDNDAKTVKVKLSNTAGFYGGNYTISFYNGGNLVGKRNIYIYSGTEINYIKTRTEQGRDTYGLDNSLFNADNIATFNVPSIKAAGGVATYYLEFNRAPFSSYDTILLSNKASQIIVREDQNPTTISDVKIISSGNKSLETKYSQEQLISGLFRPHLMSEVGNVFRIQVGARAGESINLSEFNNCMIQFKLKISSILYADCEREYIINLFICDRYSASTSNLYTVFYNLNGGENNEGNITKYPRYAPIVDGDTICDPDMTSFELLNPTKIGSVFSGWFLDEDFTRQIDRLDSNIQGNVTLYAKWESLNTNYFDISLALEGIKDYNNNPKNLYDRVVYGDSVNLKFTFTRNDPLENNTYTIHYFFYVTDLIDSYFSEEDVNAIENSASKIGNKYFGLNFPKLKSGNHTFKIKVKVTINGILEVIEETSIAVNVDKKMVVFGFTDLSKEYNGYIQEPTVSMVEDFYPEDYAVGNHSDLYNLTCGVESRNARDYNFYISEILNKNYTFDSNAETSKCVFTITKKVISLDWNDDFSPVYDGQNHFPEYEVVGIVFGDSVAFEFNISECKNAGTYSVYILPETITNDNYTVDPNTDFDFEFEIKKSKIKIIMHGIEDRIQTKPEKRAVPTFEVIGTYHSVEDLQLNISSEAFKASKSGNYTVSCVVGNSNYEVEVVKSTYTLTGYYNVYYQLSNGTVYTERVEEGKSPVGVTKEQLGVPKFSKISYSDDYLVNGSDIYVEVDYKDYSAIVYTGIIFVVGAVIIFIIYWKKRENGVR